MKHIDEINEIKGLLNNIRGNNLGEDLIEYCRLSPERTGLSVELFADDGGAYKRNNHPSWVYVRNGYSSNAPLFPVIISSSPVLPNIEYDISDSELRAVLSFISTNCIALEKLANDEVDHVEFFNMCKPVVSSFAKNRKVGTLNEMAKMRPSETGLSTMLWVDEGTSPQHGPRIKFQASKEQKTTREFSSMSISDRPQTFNLPKRCDINSKELLRIAEFIIKNKDALIELCKKEIDILEFARKIKKV